MPPFRERFPSTVWVVLLDSKITNSQSVFGGELASYLVVGFPWRCMLPLTRRFAPRRSAQTKVVKRPSPLFLNADIQWRPLFKPRFPLHGFYLPFPAYRTLTIGEGGNGHNISPFPGGCPQKSPFREYILTNPCWNELSLGQACPSANGIFYLTPRRGPLVTFPMQ